ncbi:hypothetical protein ACFQU3_20040 [Terrabacter sp. GCM10028922]|uniref:hypothetical protein n=1 Tax=Terrabacter sp. GCM10028922 TaxID=3273428 RepID=UPI00361CC419
MTPTATDTGSPPAPQTTHTHAAATSASGAPWTTEPPPGRGRTGDLPISAGGIGSANAASYLALQNVGCVGGSWLTPRDALLAGDWGRIQTIALQASMLRVEA